MKILDRPIIKGDMVLRIESGFMDRPLSDVEIDSMNLLRKVFTQLGGTFEPYVAPEVKGEVFKGGYVAVELTPEEKQALFNIQTEGHTF